MLQNLLYLPINSIGYPRIKKLQRDNLLHAYNEPINIYSAVSSMRDHQLRYSRVRNRRKKSAPEFRLASQGRRNRWAGGTHNPTRFWQKFFLQMTIFYCLFPQIFRPSDSPALHMVSIHYLKRCSKFVENPGVKILKNLFFCLLTQLQKY